LFLSFVLNLIRRYPVTLFIPFSEKKFQTQNGGLYNTKRMYFAQQISNILNYFVSFTQKSGL